MQNVRPRRGEIWLVSLDPTIGSELQKTRPAVVVNATIFDLIDVRIIVPLTTWQDRFAKQINKILVSRTTQNGLTTDSAADFLQARCVSVQRFVNKIGTIEAAVLEEIIAGIAIAIDYQP